MDEQATPQTGAMQESDVLKRMGNFMTQFDEDQGGEVEPKPTTPEPATQEPQTAEPPEGQATDDLTEGDIPEPEVAAQPDDADAFEIVHNGQQVKLTREETIKHAQQGFDYTRKSEAVAVKDRQVTERLARLAQIEQVQPQLFQELATVKAIEAQLNAYQGVDWVKVATDEPLDYPRYRAQFDTLVQSYNAAAHQYQQKSGAVDQARKQLDAQMLAQEWARLPEIMPAWKDPQKYAAAQTEIRDYLTENGIDEAKAGGALNSAFAMKVLYQSRQYEKLLKAKTDKVKQLRTAPPVQKPGATESAASVQTTNTKKLQDRLKRTGDVKDAAALLASRW